MNAITLLRHEHDDIRALLEGLWDASGAERRLERIRELAAVLILHAQLEEKFLYAAMEDTGDAEAAGLVGRARQEHARIEDLIEMLLTADEDRPGVEPGISEFQRTVLAHVREEEGRVFPVAEQRLGEMQLVSLGRLMDEWRTRLDAAA